MPIKIDPKEQYIVYGLIDPNTKQIRYIGKSIQGEARIHDHWYDSSFKEGNTKKISWIKSLKKQNKKYEYCILFVAQSTLPKEEANIVIYEVEQQLIQIYRNLGYDLTNLTDGGPGVIGRKVSEATRKKMSESAKKRPMPQAIIDQQKAKGKPRKKKIRTLAEGRPSRAIPGAREKFANKLRKMIIRENKSTGEIIQILGLKKAARAIGSTCNKTGIRLAIKSGNEYYGYIWSFV